MIGICSSLRGRPPAAARPVGRTPPSGGGAASGLAPVAADRPRRAVSAAPGAIRRRRAQSVRFSIDEPKLTVVIASASTRLQAAKGASVT